MIRPATMLITVAALLVSSTVVAQDRYHSSHAQPSRTLIHDDRGHHDWDHHWERPVHVPDVRRLDEYSDRLAKIAEHLHDDAHKLSQDYEHSASIEGYVSQLERLQEHMHEILHDVARTGRRAASAVEHVKGDVSQSKTLLNRLYGELKHQGFDGARSSDFHAMAHMREIIVRDAFPLVRAMEGELYGYRSAPVDPHRVHRRPHRQIQTYRRVLPSFRINF